jgi:hypothetical protein
MTQEQQEGYVNGLMQVSGTPVTDLPYQNGTSLGISEAFYEAETGQGAYANAFASVVNELISGETVSTGDVLVAEMRPYLAAGLTDAPASEGAALSDSAFEEVLMPLELDAAPETGGASLVLQGAISLAGVIFDAIAGPPVTQPPPEVTTLAVCNNDSEMASIEASAHGPCLDERSSVSTEFYPCVTALQNNFVASVALQGQWVADDGGGTTGGDPYGDCGGPESPNGGLGIDVRQAGALGEMYLAEEQIGAGGPWRASGWTDARCGTGFGYNGWIYDELGSPFTTVSAEDPGYGETNGVLPANQPWIYGCEDSLGVPHADPVVADVESWSDFKPTGVPSGTAPASMPVTTIPWCQTGQFVYESAECAGVMTAAPQALQGQIDSTSPAGQVMQGLVATTLTAPAEVRVPDCAGRLYPESYAVCASQLQAAGLNPVQEPATDPECNSTGDPVGTVECVSTVAEPGYSAAGSGYVEPGSSVYVYAEPLVPVDMPDCTGLDVVACEAAIAGAGIETAPAVDWSPPGSLIPGAVISTDPAGGAVVTNPVSATVTIYGAGLVLPAPSDNELATTYATQLETAGFPAPSVTYLGIAEQDPNLQLGAVVTVSPEPDGETAYNPADPPSEDITANPTANGLAEPIPGDPYTGPVIDPDGLEFPTVPSPCHVFPFGVPCWVRDQINQLVTTSTPPAFSLPVPFFSTSLGINLGTVFGVDTGAFMDVWRPTIGFVTLVGITVWLAGFALGGHSGHGGGDGGED